MRLNVDNTLTLQSKALAGFVAPQIKNPAAPATTSNAKANALIKGPYCSFTATSTPQGAIFKAFDFSGFGALNRDGDEGARAARPAPKREAESDKPMPRLHKSPTDEGKRPLGRVNSKTGVSPKNKFRPEFGIGLVSGQHFNLTSSKFALLTHRPWTQSA